jgi:hypothetical protein
MRLETSNACSLNGTCRTYSVYSEAVRVKEGRSNFRRVVSLPLRNQTRCPATCPLKTGIPMHAITCMARSARRRLKDLRGGR